MPSKTNINKLDQSCNWWFGVRFYLIEVTLTRNQDEDRNF